MSSTVSDEASSRATGFKRDWRLLHVDDAGSRTYESKGPDHEALLTVDRDGRRAVHEIAMCGYCLGGRCEYHPDGPARDVFGPVYSSDLLAERQASTPVTGPPDGAPAPPEAVQDIVEAQAPVLEVEPQAPVDELPSVPTVPPEVEQAAKALAFQVRSRGVMHRNGSLIRLGGWTLPWRWTGWCLMMIRSGLVR